MLGKDGVRHVTVRNKLYGTVVIEQLLLCYYIRVVAVYVAVYAYDAAYNTRYGTQVVRHHHYSHLAR